MYIESVPNRKSPPAILLREAFREGGKIRKKTVANLTHWPEHFVKGLRLIHSSSKLATTRLWHSSILAEVSIEREAALDGIYVLRTNVEKEMLSAEDTVVTYKSLSQVERAIRTMKGMDIRIRPIRHFTEEHVRAHLFLCMLAYYVEWNLRRALDALLYPSL